MKGQSRRAPNAPPYARLVLAAAASLLLAAQGPVIAHAEPRVIMMVGGVENDRPRASVVRDVMPDTEESVSLVLQFDEPRTGSSVKAQVMALLPLVESAAYAAGVDSALLMAVIDVESGGDPRALSKQGAAGLMQLMPATGQLYGATDPFDAQQNIVAGARFLRRLLTRFGNLDLALAAYNAGEDAVRRFNGAIPPYRETARYVPRVIERYGRYREVILAMRAPPRMVMSGAAHRAAPPQLDE
jgi:hypothetical protein